MEKAGSKDQTSTSPACWCVRNSQTMAVLFLFIFCFGIWRYFTIPRRENPEFTVRTAIVLTRFPGASPSDVEHLVTEKLEDAIRQIEEVDHVRSESRAGMSIIQVDVGEQYYRMEPVWNDLRDRVRDTVPDLPRGALRPRVNDTFGDVFGVVAVLTGDDYTIAEKRDVARELRDRLLNLQQVGKVALHGINDECIYVNIPRATLARLGLNPAQIRAQLQGENSIVAAGDKRLGPKRVVFRVTGTYDTLEDIRSAEIALPGRSTSVRLDEIAAITREIADPPRIRVYHNGHEAITIAVSLVPGGNIEDMGEDVSALLRTVESELPVGMNLSMLVYQPKFVTRAIRQFIVNLLEAFLFVFIVVLLFTNTRMGLIVGALVPMAMLASVSLMPVVGVELQRVSIAALIICLGMLVDNGTVVSENMLVRVNVGSDRMQSVAGTVQELWRPLLAASLTTIAAFMPILLADSATGEYTLSLFLVVALTLMCSWTLSMTFVPLLCYHLLPSRRSEQRFDALWYRLYRRMLHGCLQHRAAFILGIAAATVLSIYGFRYVPEIFFPPNEREMFTVDFWQPYGTDIVTTESRARALEDWLLSQPDVLSTGVFVGEGGPRWYLPLSPEQPTPNYAFFVVNTTKPSVVPDLIRRTRTRLKNFFPDTRYSVQELENGPPVGTPIQIRLSGRDAEELYQLRDIVDEKLQLVRGVSSIHDDWGEWRPKLIVEVDQKRVKRLGLDSRRVADSIRVTVSGLYASDYREADNILPIMIREDRARDVARNLSGLPVFINGDTVPLSEVATLTPGWEVSNIRHRDGIRTMTVKADVVGRNSLAALQEARSAIDPLVHSESWPAGYHIAYGGEHEETREARNEILAGMPIALGLIVLILVAQFNSIRTATIIFLMIPPTMPGVTSGLLLTHAPFGFMALLGISSLMGVVVNNAIMMLERIGREVTGSDDPQQSLLLAAQKRLRPVIMTTLTTVTGLIPLSLQGGDMWRPLANVIIFGLSFSTIVTLLLCPVLYSLFYRISFSKNTIGADHGGNA